MINTGLIEKNRSSIARIPFRNRSLREKKRKKKRKIARLASSWNKLLVDKTWQMEPLGILEH